MLLHGTMDTKETRLLSKAKSAGTGVRHQGVDAFISKKGKQL